MNENRLIWEAYQNITESPENFEVGKSNRKTFKWDGNAKLIAPYMFINNEWIIGEGISFNIHSYTHIDMFIQYVSSICAREGKQAAIRILSQYDIDYDDYNDFKQSTSNEEFFRLMKRLHTGKMAKEIRFVNKAGRLWIDPITDEKEKLYGLFLSSWIPLNNNEKINTVNGLTPLLNEAGYKWNQVVWDGDEYIDPSQQHTQISRINMPSKLDWDDIAYSS